ncbi:MAG: hypothetical protein KAR39_12500 [Thermoplasmata archaeon]|nr:hypothetical protein [Thermoplasmata archaeon]
MFNRLLRWFRRDKRLEERLKNVPPFGGRERVPKNTGCPCRYQAPTEKCCLHPGIIGTITVFGFKGEVPEKRPVCDFQRYYGPTSLSLSDFTREEYEEFMQQYTICLHPDEFRWVKPCYSELK